MKLLLQPLAQIFLIHCIIGFSYLLPLLLIFSSQYFDYLLLVTSETYYFLPETNITQWKPQNNNINLSNILKFMQSTDRRIPLQARWISSQSLSTRLTTHETAQEQVAIFMLSKWELPQTVLLVFERIRSGLNANLELNVRYLSRGGESGWRRILHFSSWTPTLPVFE